MIDANSIGGYLWRLRDWLLGHDRDRFQFECRRCGQSVSNPGRSCPACGAAEIASYEL